jgi:hypothetical protein
MHCFPISVRFRDKRLAKLRSVASASDNQCPCYKQQDVQLQGESGMCGSDVESPKTTGAYNYAQALYIRTHVNVHIMIYVQSIC